MHLKYLCMPPNHIFLIGDKKDKRCIGTIEVWYAGGTFIMILVAM